MKKSLFLFLALFLIVAANANQFDKSDGVIELNADRNRFISELFYGEWSGSFNENVTSFYFERTGKVTIVTKQNFDTVKSETYKWEVLEKDNSSFLFLKSSDNLILYSFELKKISEHSISARSYTGDELEMSIAQFR